MEYTCIHTTVGARGGGRGVLVLIIFGMGRKVRLIIYTKKGVLVSVCHNTAYESSLTNMPPVSAAEYSQKMFPPEHRKGCCWWSWLVVSTLKNKNYRSDLCSVHTYLRTSATVQLTRTPSVLKRQPTIEIRMYTRKKHRRRKMKI